MKRGYFLLTAAMIVASTSIIMSCGEADASVEVETHAEPVKMPYLDMTIQEYEEIQNVKHRETTNRLRTTGKAELLSDATDQQEPEGPSVEPEESGQETGGDSESVETAEYGCDPVLTYIGNWTITFYCPCEICCGQWATGCTASGVAATEWHTVATDMFPFGTELYVDGLGYFVVEDTGVSGEWLDVFVNDHQQALDLGMQTRDVYYVESNH